MRTHSLVYHTLSSNKVVGYAEIMEMLTNYDYTIDLTSDAGGDAETWGAEGGYGIISASQMLAWVAANCGESCPGETDGSNRNLPQASLEERGTVGFDNPSLGCPPAVPCTVQTRRIRNV